MFDIKKINLIYTFGVIFHYPENCKVMGLVHIQRAKMRIFSAHNSTFLLLSKLGMFDIPSPLIKRDYSSFPQLESLSIGIPTSLTKNNYFHQPKRQAVLYHSKSLLSIPEIESNHGGKRKHRNKRSNDRTDSLPIFLVPGLTSFFFYSTKQEVSFLSEGINFNISTGVYCLPKTENNPKKGKNCTPLGCGEDSFSIAQNDYEVILAVADGVGGWRSKGIDPAIFSQTLMYHAAEISKAPNEKFKYDDDRPKTLIHDAFWRLVEDFKAGRKKPFGSSTACVVMINRETGQLKFGNLGDSGFVLLSPVDTVEGLGTRYRIKFKSESQQHRFNMPYQITLVPPNGRVSDTTDLTATDNSSKLAKKLIVETGDIVLLMTDGVLDNIFDDELEELVSSSITIRSRKNNPNDVPNLVAQDIAFKARELSENSRRESPFTVEARKHGLTYLGGKEDDITVVAAIIYPKNANK